MGELAQTGKMEELAQTGQVVELVQTDWKKTKNAESAEGNILQLWG